jgi:hypothetical protein
VGKDRVILEDHPRVPLVGRDGIDPPVVEGNAPPVLLVKSCYRPQKGCLAASRRPEEGEELPSFDDDIDIIEGFYTGNSFLNPSMVMEVMGGTSLLVTRPRESPADGL